MCLVGASKKAEYLKTHHIFSYIGNFVRFQPRIVPFYPELIKLHDNVFIARNVHFETHDTIHSVLNSAGIANIRFPEFVGCIKIMGNCLIGSDVTILYRTRIGRNVIVGSGSLVTRDLASDSVYAGVPAKRIGSFEDFVSKRQDMGSY